MTPTTDTPLCSYVAPDGECARCDLPQDHLGRHGSVHDGGPFGEVVCCPRCGFAAVICDDGGPLCDRGVAVRVLQQRGFDRVWSDRELQACAEAGVRVEDLYVLDATTVEEWAPRWALDVLRSTAGTRNDRVALLRRLRFDAVAQALVVSHPDAVKRLVEGLRAEASP